MGICLALPLALLSTLFTHTHPHTHTHTHAAMSGIIPIIVMTIFFGGAGVLGFLYAGKNTSDRGLVRVMIVTTCICLWLFWLCAFMAQLHPLVAPELKAEKVCLVNNVT